jgi:hypothetical protein
VSRRTLAVLAALIAVATVAAVRWSRHRDTPRAIVLENGKTHYGKTYPEWASAWWRWYLETPQPTTGCVLLTEDATGERCDFGQPPDAFFLVGTLGSTVVRTRCVVPSGRPIFFPIVNMLSDGAGDSPAEQVTREQHAARVTDSLNKATSLAAKVDGVALDIARFRVDVTSFSYTLPPEPNLYSCGGSHGVTGKVDPSWQGGYWVLLAPLSAGRHEISFKGTLHLATGESVVDVTYHLRVQ